MIFTNQIEHNEKDTCYYRKAYSPEIFDSLSLDEKRSLIAFTVGEFASDVEVVYADELGNEIGILTEQDVLLISSTMLSKAPQAYSSKLYLFLYDTLMRRFVARKRNYIPVIEEGYISKKWKKKDYRSHTLDVIILHLLLDELLEMTEVVFGNDEERTYFLDEIEKVRDRVQQAEEIRETISVEAPSEQSEIAEHHDAHHGRGR